MELKRIAVFRSPFKSKFGIPRQSGIVEEVEGEIVFEPKYGNVDAVRGLEHFRYLWLIWGFSANAHKATSPVVRPPMLGGNEHVGVFATRSPYRPNAIGLSSVRILRIDPGPIIRVAGADLMDGTPIYDIKPYLEYTDCHTGAGNGFTKCPPSHADEGEQPDRTQTTQDDNETDGRSENVGSQPTDKGLHRDDDRFQQPLRVVMSEEMRLLLPPTDRIAIVRLLELDPRPRYHNDPKRVYGMTFRDADIRFTVSEGTLTVVEIRKQ